MGIAGYRHSSCGRRDHRDHQVSRRPDGHSGVCATGRYWRCRAVPVARPLVNSLLREGDGLRKVFGASHECTASRTWRTTFAIAGSKRCVPSFLVAMNAGAHWWPPSIFHDRSRLECVPPILLGLPK
jgi:hypothetical protein